MKNKPHYYVFPGINQKAFHYALIQEICNEVAKIFAMPTNEILKKRISGNKKNITEARMIIALCAREKGVAQIRVKEFFQLKEQTSVRYYEQKGKELINIYPELKEKFALAMAN